mmetsp:Transcript_4289/g.8276  ORF Transcript_4289/g.8276 Transcript_4289/m.8276 type:complete len:439 (-) Transcript_4289:55-1371(-)
MMMRSSPPNPPYYALPPLSSTSTGSLRIIAKVALVVAITSHTMSAITGPITGVQAFASVSSTMSSTSSRTSSRQIASSVMVFGSLRDLLESNNPNNNSNNNDNNDSNNENDPLNPRSDQDQDFNHNGPNFSRSKFADTKFRSRNEYHHNEGGGSRVDEERGLHLDRLSTFSFSSNAPRSWSEGGGLAEEEEEEEEEEYIARAMRETFETVDRGLLDETDIEPMYSGTTACVVLLRNNKLHISNCGDSRAVLARKSDGNPKETKNESDNQTASERRNLTTIPLSIDQNPDSPGEKERILSSGGYVSPPPEPGLSARVWLDAANTQIGLAMARSIGDHAVKGVGVIAEPVVTTHDLEAGDEFLIIATDGVWEFISSEDAVEIVGRHLYGDGGDDDDGGGSGASVACEALIKAASEKWHEHEGDYRDDITAIVIRLKDLLS